MRFYPLTTQTVHKTHRSPSIFLWFKENILFTCAPTLALEACILPRLVFLGLGLISVSNMTGSLSLSSPPDQYSTSSSISSSSESFSMSGDRSWKLMQIGCYQNQKNIFMFWQGIYNTLCYFEIKRYPLQNKSRKASGWFK